MDLEQCNDLCDTEEHWNTPGNPVFSSLKMSDLGGANMCLEDQWNAVISDSGYCGSAVASSSHNLTSESRLSYSCPDEALVPKRCLLSEFDVANLPQSASLTVASDLSSFTRESTRSRRSYSPTKRTYSPIKRLYSPTKLSSVNYDQNKCVRKSSRFSLDSRPSIDCSVFPEANQLSRDRSVLRQSSKGSETFKHARISNESVEQAELQMSAASLSPSEANHSYKYNNEFNDLYSVESSMSPSYRKRISNNSVNKTPKKVSISELVNVYATPGRYTRHSSFIMSETPEKKKGAALSYIASFATPSRKTRQSTITTLNSLKKVKPMMDHLISPVKLVNNSMPDSNIKSPFGSRPVTRSVSRSTSTNASCTPKSNSMSPNELIDISPTSSTESAVALASCTRRLNLDSGPNKRKCDVKLDASFSASMQTVENATMQCSDSDSGFMSTNSSSLLADCFPSHELPRTAAMPCSLMLKPRTRNEVVALRGPASNVSHINRVSDRFVIGNKMKEDFVDIITELQKRNITSVLSSVFSYLSTTDLIRAQGVSRGWRESVKSDPAASARIEEVKKEAENPDIKENRRSSGKVIRRPRRTETNRLLADIQTPEPENESSAKIKTRSVTNAEKFWQEATKLSAGESLVKCPKCTKPAAKNLSTERGRCSNNLCKFDFCTKCLLTYHHPTGCVTDQGRRLRSDTVVGSKKSRQNLRRL